MHKRDIMNFSLHIFPHSTTSLLKGHEEGPQLTATAAELPQGASWLNTECLQIPPMMTAVAAHMTICGQSSLAY